MAKTAILLALAACIVASVSANTRLDIILSGRELPNEDPFSGAPDVYAIVSYAPTPLDSLSEIGKTSAIDNNNNPDWTEVFNFFLYGDMQQKIKIDLWDSDFDSDDYLGYVELPLMKLVQASNQAMDLRLSTGKGSLRLKGRVNHTRIAGTGSDDIRFLHPVQMIALPPQGVEMGH